MSHVTVYYDYLCPYVYRAAAWMDKVQKLLSDPPTVSWRYFSLTQVNHRLRDGWKVWDQPGADEHWTAKDYARGLRFFWAAEAARRQGEPAFARLHTLLLHTIHEGHEELSTYQSVLEVAACAELDLPRFENDLADSTCLARLAVDHTSGTELGVFGTPTFVFADAEPAYLKLTRVLDDPEALDCWHSFHTVVATQPYIREIKRPQ